MTTAIPLSLGVQLAGAGAAFATMTLWPPAEGDMLMIPLAATPAATIDAAVAGRAAVLAAGPLGGSIVVRGDRTRLMAAIGGRPILLLAAPPAICGEGGRS